MNKFQKSILNHAPWLGPISSFAMMLSVKFLDYDPITLKDGLWRSTVEFIISCLPLALAISSLVYLLVIFIEIWAKPKLKKIQKDLDKAESRNKVISGQVGNLLNNHLYNLANKLKFGQLPENNERISLYIHEKDEKDEKDNTFIPCGRYSANPKYSSPSRTSYPDNEGCISKGWENGWHFDNDFPCAKNERKYYNEYCQKKYNIQSDTCEKINMKSQLFAVHSIVKDGKPLAVLVLESIKANRFSEDTIKDILKEQNDSLAEIIHHFEKYIPKPSNASKVGL